MRIFQKRWEVWRKSMLKSKLFAGEYSVQYTKISSFYFKKSAEHERDFRQHIADIRAAPCPDGPFYSYYIKDNK